jgi:hypothetical protein
MKRLFLYLAVLFLLCACGQTSSAEPEAHGALLALYDACAEVRTDTAACLQRLDELGYCAVDTLGRYNMTHPEQIEALMAGENPAAEILVLCPDGGFEAVTLTGARIDTARVAEVGGVGAITWEKSYELESLNYTDKGWLILTRIMPDNPESDNHGGWQEPTLLFRVKPVDMALRMACRQYIEPVGYGTNGFFLTDWDTESPEGLDLAGLFPAAYAVFYDRDLIYYESPYPVDETSTYAYIPAAEFESIMQNMLDLTAEQMRALAEFDGEAYRVRTVRTIDARYLDVFPEVTAMCENEDGTITITVDGVSAALRTDQAFTHRVTVRREGGHVIYLGNAMEAPRSAGKFS